MSLRLAVALGYLMTCAAQIRFFLEDTVKGVNLCNTSAYGCCPDGETPAHGPEHEGCCLIYEFGCCPDNYKPADGPHLEGCGCKSAHFGCCPDNVTIARGPDNEGCGCQYTQFGCCPDRRTESQGPEFEGCKCHTYQFGCCADGVRVATGPSLQGCICQYSKYGCCGDEVTAAKGPNKAGCDCSNSKFGCCPDGVTEAKGDKFLNCSDVPENKQDSCNLPKVKGICEGYNIRWYYDASREQCSQFVYGGCLGNNNNFDSQALCQERCEPDKTKDQCNLPIEQGSCAGNFVHWGYDPQRRRCVQFIWGGCEGNSNRFISEAACKLRCSPPGVPIQACSLPQDAGNCTEKHPAWSFSLTENRCIPFYYTGCGGNENRFDTEQACDTSCPSAYVQEMCTLPAVTGECAKYTQRWYYNTKHKRCRQFNYGGCGGNENNFVSEFECENRCMEQPIITTLAPQTQTPVTAAPQPQTDPNRSDYCFEQIDSGPCAQLEERWAYDSARGVCTRFQYGGCGGNRNNFPSLEYCQYYCAPAQDICQLPMLSGPCDASLMRWFYDATTDSCSQFTYSGCEGNENRFNSMEECEQQCRTRAPATTTTTSTTTTTTTTTIAPEYIPPECQVFPTLEECRDAGEVWYLDLRQRACVAHINVNSGFRCRNTGVYSSQEACKRSCGAFRDLAKGVHLCNTSAYGCCPDGETPAHGPEYEGCCLIYEFGCCPDNYKPADGPHLEGCGCKSAHFGCCPDNVTIARGPDNEGCGCQYTQFGCCPDRRTESQGPEFEGCTCHTYQFGCCADGVRVATGPSLQGCICQYSKYGCCGDEVTAAKGPNKAGCDCSNSKFGCCPDGVTEAKGDKFLNCSDVPENKQDSCNLPKVKGICEGYNIRWYYDASREQCSQFVYGGCLGNNNNFDSQALCQERCEPDKTKDQCNLPIEQGSCAGNFVHWGYDPQRRRCVQFIWGGCEGNSNRFISKAACKLRCSPPGVPIQACSLPQDAGNCTENHPAWSFSLTKNRCLPFYYTGCGGNENRFDTEQACDTSCPSAYVQEMCTLPAVTGECAEYTQRWYYDTKHKRCRQFNYGGCGGNENNFVSEFECENRCMEQPIITTLAPQTQTPVTAAPQPQTDPNRSDYCFEQIDSGPCAQLEERWGYDSARGVCTQFQYGGCGGNRNNFPSLEYCQYYCAPAQDICQLPMLSGPCDASLMRWFYDATTDSCSQFTYSGCEGNENRFNSMEECERQCRTRAPATTTTTSTTTTTTTTTIAPEYIPPECQVSPTLEECRDAGEVWYLDLRQRACVAHINANSGFRCRNTGVYSSQEACERSCGAFRDLVQEMCTLSAVTGECAKYTLRWYYDTKHKRCRQFYYGGCGGNENNFMSEFECENRCMEQPIITTLAPQTQTPVTAAPQPQTDPNRSDYCFEQIDSGPCAQLEERWAYDSARGVCTRFQYGGCGGNRNNFPSLEYCQYYCAPAQDICQLPMLSGPCDASLMRWFYDATTDSCSQFTYSGCEGNENRFNSMEECEQQCRTRAPATTTTTSTTTTTTTTTIAPEYIPPECQVFPTLEECRDAGEVWYLDLRQRACVAHINVNSGFRCRNTGVYSSQEACKRSCGAFRDLAKGVHLCNTSAYGCCPDGETPAHGPEYEGCCLIYEFGCCPDNYKPADGPHLEGCGCKSAHFGCCPDNVTIARGPDNEGCGCQYTQFGCCPDRRTESQGPEFEGCTCHTYQFGCCADGVRVATGPSLQGCICQYSKYGCCGDEVTAAKGPNKAGCDCSNSKFGCCPDGVTEAKGDKFLNCSDVPENKQDSCNLPKVKGICEGYNIRWYYDASREQCSQFVYGGCLGNNNNFDSQALCQERCEPDKTKDQCNLPIEQGSCAGNFVHWGYDPQRRRCVQFIWGGCEGNSNRFISEAACKLRCSPPGVPIQACSLPQDAGNCTENHPAWSFSLTKNRCLPFYYTGCGGNENRFDTEQACDTYCPSAYVQEMCTLPAVTGECAEYTQRWYYDTKHKRCRQFNYGGCGGNENNFMSEFECENRCMEQPIITTLAPQTQTPVTAAPQPQTDPNRSDICQLPMLSGPCDASLMRWFYDATTDSCSQFAYSGCEGNENRFNSMEECERQCRTRAPATTTTTSTTTTTTTTTIAPEYIPPECQVSPTLEECRVAGEVWYLDLRQRACVAHINANSGFRCRNTGVYSSQEACERSCGAFRDLVQEMCTLSAVTGECAKYTLRWYYDTKHKRCRQFYYGGCGGNENNFMSEFECENRCMEQPIITTLAPQTQTPVTAAPQSQTDPNRSVQEMCTLPAVTGECAKYTLRWYYDTKHKRCRQFYYGGCGGNENNFMSEFECENRCMEQPIITTLAPQTQTPVTAAPQPQTDPNRSDYCFEQIDSGPCAQLEERWAYDSARGVCTRFQYGGCGGNRNNFPSLEYCQYYCAPAQDICQLPMLSGPCDASLMRWFYDATTDSCSQFTYSGCEGNENRFNSMEECERQCRTRAPATTTTTSTTTTTTTTTIAPEYIRPECQVSPTLEECRDAGEVWYLDLRQRACVAHINANSGFRCRNTGVYSSQEACERSCGALRDLDVCRYQVDPGPCEELFPKVYFDYATSRCLQFTYGGCYGGPNRFSSIEECEQVCRPPAIDPCNQPLEQGDCRAYIYMWHYDASRDECEEFVYGGCKGNDNRFQTQQKCEYRCKKGSTTAIVFASSSTTPTTTSIRIRNPSTTISPFYPIELNSRFNEPECTTPSSVEPCVANVTVYYYDTRTQACLVGDFGGCRYRNSYRTEEECERRCGAFQGLDVCRANLDPGPCLFAITKYYWDAVSGQCLPFAYGGCHGGPNRFSTAEECEEVCGTTGPGQYIPANCKDSPYFANCNSIVRNKFCHHKYYATFCCKSCVEAGQLDPNELD